MPTLMPARAARPTPAGHRDAHRRFGEAGLTLLELVVALVIVGLLLAIAVPRYLAFRRNALIAEANSILQEVKTLAWAYYQQHESWEGIDTGNMDTRLGFTPAPASCWTYTVDTASMSQLAIKATGTMPPVKCTPALGVTVTLRVRSDGSAERTQTMP